MPDDVRHCKKSFAGVRAARRSFEDGCLSVLVSSSSLRRTDSVTGATWEGNVVPTRDRINASGNTCQAVPPPEANHTVSLAPDSSYWPTIRDFLWARLNLATAP